MMSAIKKFELIFKSWNFTGNTMVFFIFKLSTNYNWVLMQDGPYTVNSLNPIILVKKQSKQGIMRKFSYLQNGDLSIKFALKLPCDSKYLSFSTTIFFKKRNCKYKLYMKTVKGVITSACSFMVKKPFDTLFSSAKKIFL